MTIQEDIKIKSGKDRIVPIHQEITDIVAHHMNSVKYLFGIDKYSARKRYVAYYKEFMELMERIRSRHYPHDTRHTFIIYAKRCGIDEYILKLIVGHTIGDITERVYVHHTVGEFLYEMQKVSYVNEIY